MVNRWTLSEKGNATETGSPRFPSLHRHWRERCVVDGGVVPLCSSALSLSSEPHLVDVHLVHVCVVVFFVQSFWHIRQVSSLWVILAIALVIHTALHMILFNLVQPWPGIAYLVTMPSEAIAVCYLIWKRLRASPRIVK